VINAVGYGSVEEDSELVMRSEFIQAINQVCSERNLSQEVVIEAVEAALVSAYKRNFGSSENIRTKLDPATGQVHVYAEKEVVEEIEDPQVQISLEDALQVRDDAELGQTVLIETTPRDFGRIAAQTAKQVILQRIREAERDVLYNTYIEREGELITGTVQSIDHQGITMNLGKTEASLPRSEQIPGERPHQNQRIKAYVVEVNKTNRGPQIIVSRTHRNMLRRLLETEVPEIFNGTVEIKQIAREAGSRSKVAVTATQEGVDPVGSCVGMRGVRIQNIVNELNGEKIDVVEWSIDVASFIGNALSPAKVMNVTLREEADGSKTASVIVPDRQLSLAIGKEGQNARLAAKLTGWRIDIKSASEAAEEALSFISEPAMVLPQTLSGEDLLAKAEAILMAKPGAEETEFRESLALTEEEASALAEGEGEEVAASEEAVSAAAVPEEETQEDLEEVAVNEIAEKALMTEPEIELTPELVEEGVVVPDAVEQPVGEGEAAEEEYLTEEEEALEELAPEDESEALLIEEEEWEPESELVEEGFYSAGEEEYFEEEEEEDEDEEDKASSKKKKSRKRTLVFDEDRGRLVAKKRRKPGRVRDWEDYSEDDYEL